MIDTITATDSPATPGAIDTCYTTGMVGVWASKNTSNIQGQWADLSLNPVVALTTSYSLEDILKPSTAVPTITRTDAQGGISIQDAPNLDGATAPAQFAVSYGPSSIGNNYVVMGDVTLNNADTELGLLARADAAGVRGYVLSLCPTIGTTAARFALLKLDGGGGESSTLAPLLDLGLRVADRQRHRGPNLQDGV